MSRAERSRRGGRDAERVVGFALHLELRPGLPLAECRQLERRLEDYAEAQDLHIEGTQLHHVVSAPGRPVGVDDQVALLDWLVDQPGVVAVRLGPIGALQSLHDADGVAGQGDAAFIHVVVVGHVGVAELGAGNDGPMPSLTIAAVQTGEPVRPLVRAVRHCSSARIRTLAGEMAILYKSSYVEP